MENPALIQLIHDYKSDPESVYNTWFVGGEERMKAFRSIRRGVRDTVDAIAAGTFGNDFKGSPLEVVMTAITEQKQVFEGAAHAFFWKPKMRIPDIYENEDNKRKFGSFLQACLMATREEQLLSEIRRLAAAQIKGLGPAAANILYFLHPTLRAACSIRRWSTVSSTRFSTTRRSWGHGTAILQCVRRSLKRMKPFAIIFRKILAPSPDSCLRSAQVG